MKRVEKEGYGYIFGNRILNTRYELTVRCDVGENRLNWFWFGIADVSDKNKENSGSGSNYRIYSDGKLYFNGFKWG